MIEQPMFVPNVQAVCVRGEGLFVIRDHQCDVFEGAVFETLAPLIDGHRTVEQILDAAAGLHEDEELLYALYLLQSKHCLRDVIQDKPTFTVRNHTATDEGPLLEYLKAFRFECAERGGLQVVLVDDYQDPVLDAYNRAALAESQPWVIVKPTGPILWLGPLFVPGKTGCHACLKTRLVHNHRVRAFLERKLGRPVRPSPDASPAHVALAAAMVANEMQRWAFTGAASLEGALLTYDCENGSLDRHLLTRRPQCIACGAPRASSLTNHSLVVSDGLGADIVGRDGGFRSSRAEDVLAALERHVSPLTGVVGYLQRLNTTNERIHVYVSGQNLAATSGSLRIFARTLRSRCSGKGLTDAQAKAGALCEAIERHAAAFQGTEEVRRATANELGAEAIMPNDCMLFSAEQFRVRDVRNVDADGFSWIPRELNPDEPLLWTPVYSLIDGKTRNAPTSYLYFHSEALVDPVGEETCLPDSNGNAAGRTYAEALLQAILELIERDAVALWWYPRTQVPAVDLESFECSFLDTCVSYHHEMGRELWVLDVTADLGVPTFVAVTRRMTGGERILMGFGAHVDARIAIQRAVAEANQILVAFENRFGATIPDRKDATTRWLRSATVAQETYLKPRSGEMRHARDYQPLADTISDALRYCCTMIQSAGMDLYGLDMTRDDIDLKVVKVICPGMRHFWSRLAPGRLYDVPVALERVARRQSEFDLNPTGMFL